MIYKDKPNVLCVTYGPAESNNAEAVYLVNVSSSQVLAALTKLKDENPAISAPAPKKDRKPRRTKAEINEHAEKARLDQEAKDREDASGVNENTLGKDKKETAWP